MSRLFRKYHRWIGIILSVPLLTTVLSGMGYTIADEWLHQKSIGSFLMSVHTFKIFHLDKIFPIMIGIGLMGLLITGLDMMGLFGKSSKARGALKS
jgi:hypothetical protein